MSADVIATRRAEAVRALRSAGCEYAAGTIESDPLRRWDVLDVFDDISGDDTPENTAAYHALALLLAALTEPT